MTAAFAETGEYTKHWPKYLTQSRPKVKKKRKKKAKQTGRSFDGSIDGQLRSREGLKHCIKLKP